MLVTENKQKQLGLEGQTNQSFVYIQIKKGILSVEIEQ